MLKNYDTLSWHSEDVYSKSKESKIMRWMLSIFAHRINGFFEDVWIGPHIILQ